MTVNFCGLELEVLDLGKCGTAEQIIKDGWVTTYLKPLMKTAMPSIWDVKYVLCEGFELVLIYRESGLYEAINVTADSCRGIAYDVISRIF